MDGRRILLGLGIVIALVATSCGGPPTPRAAPEPSEPGVSPSPSVRPSPTGRPTRSPHPPSPSPSPSSPAPSPEPSVHPPIDQVPPSLLGTEWTRLPTGRKVVALTFDGGANADGAPSILDTLRRRDVPATFFLTGRWVESFPELAGRVGRRYPVGNHTYDHPNLVRLTRSAIREQIRDTETLIGHSCGGDPRPLFRFPYGASDRRTIGIVNQLGYGSIRWTVDTLGWKGTVDGQSAGSVRARVLDGLQPGAIVLMHLGSAPDDSTLDADALPELIDAIRDRGYRFVTVARFTRRD